MIVQDLINELNKLNLYDEIFIGKIIWSDACVDNPFSEFEKIEGNEINIERYAYDKNNNVMLDDDIVNENHDGCYLII